MSSQTSTSTNTSMAQNTTSSAKEAATTKSISSKQPSHYDAPPPKPTIYGPSRVKRMPHGRHMVSIARASQVPKTSSQEVKSPTELPKAGARGTHASVPADAKTKALDNAEITKV
ncbi:hypothetical protein MMC21_005156 [Puttea exsequens]|nr:hypothetical protein [Puttea exsequens]